MWRKTRYYFIFLMLILPITALASGTMRMNNIQFMSDPLIDASSISFQVTRHSVTDGQPFQIIDQSLLYAQPSSNNRVQNFYVFSGRHHSVQVVNAVKQWGYSTPQDVTQMNFAVEGILSLTYNKTKFVCPGVVLTQTGFAFRNIWYVLSKNGYLSRPLSQITQIACNTLDGRRQVFWIERKMGSKGTEVTRSDFEGTRSDFFFLLPAEVNK